MRNAGHRPVRWLLLTTILWPAVVGAQAEWTRESAVFSPCETTFVDAGRPEARWALGDGVYSDERDRRGQHHAWTSRNWHARLLLASAGERTLRLIGRPGPPRLTLRAFWNNVDLGSREVRKGRAKPQWKVPATATRPGINRLRFESSDANERQRQLSFRLDRLELLPARPECGVVEIATAGSAFTLPPGAVLLALTHLPPRAEVELELNGAPGGGIELFFSRYGETQRRVQLATGGGRQTERLDLGDLLSTEIVAVAKGPGATGLRLLEISGDERPAAWRTACGLLWKEPLAAAGLLSLMFLAVAVGRRWPEGPTGLWIDCGLLFVLAAVLRFAYLDAYPDLDPGRFGDSWEYLRRSRYLLHGAPFWSDTSWHAWLSWIRPPGYYLFLAVFLGPVGGGMVMVGNAQAVLLAATVVAGYLAVHPLFGRGAALVTGLLIAFYPQTITSATWILSDPLSLFLTTTALAGLSWLAVRPGWPLALATGAVFGIACLVRSAPLYFVPLAALLLYFGQRRPRRKAPSIALIAATLLVILPWCVRNSSIYGKPMGIDDLMIPNFLMAHPDPEILPAELEGSGVWGEAGEQREQYFRWLWRGNDAAHLTLDSGGILTRGLLRMVASPGTTLRRFGLHLKIYFQDFGRDYSAHFLDEDDGCRVSSWTDALNLIYLFTLILAVPGTWLAVRRRNSWPLIAWILFFVVVTNLFFYPSYMPGRYRLPIYPALAALAGLAFSRGVERILSLRRPAGRLRRPADGA